MSKLLNAAKDIEKVWLEEPDPTKMAIEMFEPMGLLRAAIKGESEGSQKAALTRSEMMERSAQCFENAGAAMKGSEMHHAWKEAGKLWREQAGVKTPQEEAEATA